MNELSTREAVERFDAGERAYPEDVKIGQWVWVHDVAGWDGQYEGSKKGDAVKWLGCVMEVGSNYVEVHSPRHKGGGHTSVRIHFDEFAESISLEPNADKIIADNIARYQGIINRLIGEVSEVMKSIGVTPTTIEGGTGGDNALVAITSAVDTKAYKTALIEIKDKTLPDLFKEIEKANEQLAKWMLAPTMGVLATIGPMKGTIRTVEDRIHTLELYAGLTEDVVLIRDGATAQVDEKLRVMQRRLYMDEECLLSYEAGGMEMREIGAFDAWLSREENFKRLLPIERTLAAFRVRRTDKERDSDSLWQVFINISLKNADKTTFLYIRNGEQLWRVNCDFVFDAKIIPDPSEFNPAQPQMVKMFGDRVDKIIPYSLWETMRDEELENRRLWEEWNARKPDDEEHKRRNPHGWFSSRMEHKEYSPIDPTNVYYDDALEQISDDIKKYNRVAVIIQGLFDRSQVLYPHAPVRVWDPASFASSIELIYDATTLTYGDKPDFEAYRKQLNASLNESSIVTGQEEVWLRVEANKENAKRRRDWRSKDRYSDLTRYRPYGNPGPGRVGPMAEWKAKARKAVFKWTRERQVWTYHGDRNIPVSLIVPADKLFNVSAYTPGDYRQFFEDPRTRQEYFRWAPLLLTAEDYLAGKLKSIPDWY